MAAAATGFASVSDCPIRWTRWRWEKRQASLKRGLVEIDGSASLVSSGALAIRLVGGLDISYFDKSANTPGDSRACVALVVCELGEADSCTVVWQDVILVRVTEPYVAGYLAFREAPHHLNALRRLRAQRPDLTPDVVLVDGNGVLHPRGFGVASHVGVESGARTVGVAKELHVIDGLQRHAARRRCQAQPGEAVPMVGRSGRTWGAALLPRPRKPLGSKKAATLASNPIFISVGHRMSLDDCVEVVKRCSFSARVPEPIRLADLLSRQRIRSIVAEERRAREGLWGEDRR